MGNYKSQKQIYSEKDESIKSLKKVLNKTLELQKEHLKSGCNTHFLNIIEIEKVLQ